MKNSERYVQRWRLSSKPHERILYVYAPTKADALDLAECDETVMCTPAGFMDREMNQIVGDPEVVTMQDGPVPPALASAPAPKMNGSNGAASHALLTVFS